MNAPMNRRQFFRICATGLGTSSAVGLGFSPQLALAVSSRHRGNFRHRKGFALGGANPRAWKPVRIEADRDQLAGRDPSAL